MNQRDRDILKRYLARRDAPCPHCGYNLRGLHSPRCPECGLTLSLQNVAGMPEWVPLRLALLKLPATALPLIINIALILAYYLLHIVIPGPAGWFQELVSIGTKGNGAPLSLFHVGAGTLCALPWCVAHIKQMDPHFAAWLDPKVTAFLWLLTAFHAFGLASLVVSNLV